MNTATQTPSGEPPPDATDPLLAEATALTLHDYNNELDAFSAEPPADDVRAQAERIRPLIQSDPRFAPFVGRRREFVDWAVQKAARDRMKQVSEVSADDAMEVLYEPRGKLVQHLLRGLGRYPPQQVPGYVRIPLEAVLLDDPRPWASGVSQFTRAAVDDLYAAHRLGLEVLNVAEDRGLKPFDVLAAVKLARLRLSDDPAWRAAPDSPSQRDRFQRAYDLELARAVTSGPAGEPAEGGAERLRPAEAASAMVGEPCPAPVTRRACGPCACAVSDVSLDKPPFPTKMELAGKTDPCQSMDYMRSLVRTYAIGENGQLFLAGERLSDRWAEATNWCWPEAPAAYETHDIACRQSLDDILYCLRRHNTKTDTVYAMRAGLYEAQLESPGLQQAWGHFVAQIAGYLAGPSTGKRRDASYRCIGVYTAAEALRRVAAAQMTSLARMQIKQLAWSLQTVWRLFTDPRVVQVIDPIAADCTSGTNSSVTEEGQADKQAAVVFEVAQQLLGPDMSGLYQAWDKAILLDQVFSWVQLGQPWRPESRCEKDEAFVGLLGAMSALMAGAGGVPLAPMPSQLPTSQTA
jgi:hypothetical protein